MSARRREPPDGFLYRPDFLTPEDERELLAHVRTLPLKEFEFHGYLAKRRVASFGWRYNYDESAIRPAAELPAFLLPLRERAARLAGLEADGLAAALVTEYSPGAPIGWHRDKKEFGDVIGVSLLSPCVFRLRRRTAEKWERYSIELAPRSAYLLRGGARTQWEHSIPEVERTRYSITFRTLNSLTGRSA